MSRSVIIPIRRSFSHTGSDPTSSTFIFSAAACNVASGGVHSTFIVISSLIRMGNPPEICETSFARSSLGTVDERRHPFVACAVRAAVHFSIVLHAMTDDTATAMGARRREHMHCALERVERKRPAVDRRNGEGFVVVVV